MQLWSDYEGRTIAEAYPLGKLLRPEGRSAFFATSNGTGTPSVIRIIEAHFDESEILNRWKTISELGEPNLVAMRKFGETELDGTPLVYAVMEPTDQTLDDVLQNRTLTVDEAKELAASLITALEALHSRGLVHEHIAAENIVAVGDSIKLRSDCIREATAGLDENSPEIEERKSRDTHDLAVVLLQALTRHRTLQGSATLLPPPFDGIIRNGLSGNWGLHQMATALNPKRAAEPATSKPASRSSETAAPQASTTPPTPAKPAPTPVTFKPAPATPVAPATARPTPATPAAAKPASATPAAPKAALTTPAAVAEALKLAEANKLAETLKQSPVPNVPATPSTPAASKPADQPRPAPDVRHRIMRPVEPDPRRKRMWIAGAVVAFLLLLLFWYFMRSSPDTKPEDRPITTLATPDKPAAATPVSSAASTAAPAKPSAAARPPATTKLSPAAAPLPAGRTQWRVVAYTYNREDQAKQKAAAIASRSPQLKPEVFAPSGHAHFLVTLGGPMSRDDAAAFRRKAVAAGLPEDTYIQNYSR